MLQPVVTAAAAAASRKHWYTVPHWVLQRLLEATLSHRLAPSGDAGVSAILECSDLSHADSRRGTPPSSSVAVFGY